MSLKKRIKRSDQDLLVKRQALALSLRPVAPAHLSTKAITGVLMGIFVLGFLAQRLIVSPGKALSSGARLALSPLSVFRLF